MRTHRAREEFEPAITYARRWLSLDPLLETPHRALMELYTLSGQRSAALRQYQECVRLLEEELGIQPAAETTQLHERIRRGELAPQSREVVVQTNRGAVPADSIAKPQVPNGQAPQGQETPSQEAVVQSSPRSGAAEDELRLVTVLSAGLSGLTDLAWDNQPEDMAVAAVTLRRMAAELALRYEARLGHIGGDSLQLLFGLPTLHEDDPGRAIQAGLDLQQITQQHGVKASMGISTGQVYFSPWIVIIANRLWEGCCCGTTRIIFCGWFGAAAVRVIFLLKAVWPVTRS